MTMAINSPPTSAADTSWTAAATEPISIIPNNPHSTSSCSSSSNSRCRERQQDAPAAAAVFEENVLRNNTNIQPQQSFHLPLTGAGGRAATAAPTSSLLQRVPTKMARATFEIELPYQESPPTLHPHPPPSSAQHSIQPHVPSDSSSCSLHNKISNQTTDSSNNGPSTEKSSWRYRLRLLLARKGGHKQSSSLQDVNSIINNSNSGSRSSSAADAAAPYRGEAMEIDDQHRHEPPPLSPYRRTRRSLGRTKGGGSRSEGLLKVHKHAMPAYIPTNANGATSTKNSYSSSSSSLNNNIEIHSTPHASASPFQRIATWLTGSSSQNNYHNSAGDEEDASSVHDFDESEWTPPDSSYGAAIPVGGWIPKKIRRSIEFSLVTLAIVALVYAVVTTSIRVTEANHNNSNNNSSNNGNNTRSRNRNNNKNNNAGGGGGLYLDDDRYITYGTDDDAGGGDDLVYNYTLSPSSFYTDDAYASNGGASAEDNNSQG